jgi:hypothetical protein
MIEPIKNPNSFLFSWIRFSDDDLLPFCRFALRHQDLVPIVTCNRVNDEGKPIGPHVYEGFKVLAIASDPEDGTATVTWTGDNYQFSLFIGPEVNEKTITFIEVLPGYFPMDEYLKFKGAAE